MFEIWRDSLYYHILHVRAIPKLESTDSMIITLKSAFMYATHITIYARSKIFSPKNKKDLGMAGHTPPPKKVKKQGEMPLPSLSPTLKKM